MIKKNMLLGVATMLITGTTLTLANNIPKNITLLSQVKGKEIVVEGTGNKRTIKVTANDVVKIEGADNKVTIEGSFTKLEVEGTANAITLLNVKKISVEGSNNMINAGTVEIVHVEGAHNHVHYKSSKNKSGKAESVIEGADNMVMKIK